MISDSNWTTIFISGKVDFRDEVRRKLEHADIRTMPGFIEQTSAEWTHDLYWMDETVPLRAFKEAIGGKLIWKYRLRFYVSQEAFMAAESKRQFEFSAREQELIDQMRKAS